MVTVSSESELAQYAASPDPYVIQIKGTIKGSGGTLRVNSNTTIIGVGNNAVIDNFGFNVSGYIGTKDDPACDQKQIGTFTPVSNVIIRNLTFKNQAAPTDGIQVQCLSHHIWVDHNTFYPSGDGSVDIKRGSDWATVSWNHFVNTDKTMLLGHDDKMAWLDEGTLHVTYHHNYFENTRQRHPRIRFGTAHVFNNYLISDGSQGKADYFVRADIGASLYMEGNLAAVTKLTGFEWVDGAGASNTKVTFAKDNEIIFLGDPFEPAVDLNNGAGFNPSDFYEYKSVYESAAGLKNSILAKAGAGKI